MLGCVSNLGDFVLFSNKLKLELGVSIHHQLPKILENTLIWKVYLNFWQVTVCTKTFGIVPQVLNDSSTSGPER